MTPEQKSRNRMDKNAFAPTPPMGWNSYDYYDTTVTEAQVKANADYMAAHLKEYGWEYVVVDIQWYARRPNARRERYQYLPFGELAMDQWSRLLPDPERFPSSAGGAGFRPLADYIHSLGLKFGIHIMRGIPRAAAHRRGRIKDCGLTADEIADPASVCQWNPDMYGVRDCEAGQAYYDSLLELYAAWGVDYIKCDDICNSDNLVPSSPRSYAGRHEIEMLHRAIRRCGRPIVLSLSPGPALIDKAWHYARYANLWRITNDMWDSWEDVKAMFARCELWQDHVRPGCYPDCDMLPLGTIGKRFGEERQTRLTRDEQRTMMTLWCIFGSPLMLGAELTRLDAWTLSLLTNREVLSLLPPENRRRQVCRDPDRAVWVSVRADGSAAYAALFNLSDEAREVALDLDELGLDGGAVQAVEVWTGEAGETGGNTLRACPAPHGCKLYRLVPVHPAGSTEEKSEKA